MKKNEHYYTRIPKPGMGCSPVFLVMGIILLFLLFGLCYGVVKFAIGVGI